MNNMPGTARRFGKTPSNGLDHKIPCSKQEGFHVKSSLSMGRVNGLTNASIPPL